MGADICRVSSRRHHVSASKGIAFARRALAFWLIYCLTLSTTNIAFSMSNLDDEPLPDDQIVHIQKHQINLCKYSVERVENGDKLVIYLIDKALPSGYRGSRPGENRGRTTITCPRLCLSI